MKTLLLLLVSYSTITFAQKTLLPHGSIFGIRPDTIGMMDASKLEVFMGKKVRISTTLRGRVIKVVNEKGGWFNLDAGKGKIIAAHFANFNINIPLTIKGKIVIVEGVAAKQLIADDLQHFAGDNVNEKKQHTAKTNPYRNITFEVKGLFVDR